MLNKTLSVFSGKITISIQSTSSSSSSVHRTLVGHLIKPNESVTITCQITAAETSSNFTWSKRTFRNHSELNSNIRSWKEGEYLYSSITLENFDYSHCGVYICEVNSGGTHHAAEMPLSINGIVLRAYCLVCQFQVTFLFFWTA